MADNEKIARWAGWKWDGNNYYWTNGKTKSNKLPSYLTDAEAIGLLNVLVDKGYVWLLCSETDEVGELIGEVRCKVRYKDNTKAVCNVYGASIHQAITGVVLQMIEKEAQ